MLALNEVIPRSNNRHHHHHQGPSHARGTREPPGLPALLAYPSSCVYSGVRRVLQWGPETSSLTRLSASIRPF
jgi:hypothetical protein